MKKYSKEWKEGKSKSRGGWAQKSSNGWSWHYISNNTEYCRGVLFFRKRDCEENNGNTNFLKK